MEARQNLTSNVAWKDGYLVDGPRSTWSLQHKNCMYRVKLESEDTQCPGMASLWPQGYCTCAI